MSSLALRCAISLAVVLVTAFGPPPAGAGEIRAVTAALVPSGDSDADGLTDPVEEWLVKKFFPNLWLSKLYDRDAFYGCITSDLYAKIPYMVEPVWFTKSVSGYACLQPGECLLLKIGLAYDRDYGDDVFNGDVFGGAHTGDSEFYYALLSRMSLSRANVKKNAAGSACTATLAQTDPNCWWLVADWTSAHAGEATDNSYHAVYARYLSAGGDSDSAVVYAAEGKHANYHRDDECDSANTILHLDNCDPSYNVRDTCFLKFTNIGRWNGGTSWSGNNSSRYIRYPLSSTERYDMWDPNEPKFAGSSAYQPKFKVNGSYLWDAWYYCAGTDSSYLRNIYCGHFDISCESDNDCSCYDSCSPNQSLLACGNGVCTTPGETCTSCPFDCGGCPPVCGNALCESGEGCSTCAADCGACPPAPVCGNFICQSGETCQTEGGTGQCQLDCGCCTGWEPVCFVAGTPVTLADGSTRPIEQLRVGDRVLAYDEASGTVVPARVRRTFVHGGAGRNLIAVDGGLFATGEHPFYVAGRAEPVPAADLRPGDELLALEDGAHGRGVRPRKVGSVRERPPVQTVYNIEVEGIHNYFAGGVLVHNKTSNGGCQPSGGGGGGPLP